MKTTIKVLGFVGILLSYVSSAQANGGDWNISIAFENGDYGVAAVDNKAITTDYMSGAHVVFYTKPYGDASWGTVGGPAYLEQMGGSTIITDPEGIGGSGGGQTSGFNYTPDPAVYPPVVDTVANASTGGYLDGLTVAQRQAYMGSFFLRTTSYSRESLVVVMDTFRMQQVSFEIWDLDGYSGGNESWRITPFDGGWGTPLTPYDTPVITGNLDSDSYDGQRYLVTLDGGLDFDRFVIEYTGNKAEGVVGLAFNNFKFTIIPEPTSGILLGLGLLAAVVFRRRLV